MKQTLSISMKYLEEKLKQGWTTMDFCNSLDVSEQDFWQYLKKNFNPKVYAYLKKRLESNCKRAKKKSKKSNSSVKITSENVVVETNAADEKSEIERLDEEEKRLRDILFNSESERQNLLFERKSCRDFLQKAQELLEQFLKRLEEEREKVKRAISRMDEIDSSVETLNKRISEAQKRLEGICVRKNQLKAIKIFCKSDGQIICEEFRTPDNLDYERFLRDIMKESFLEDLTLKEMKFMARLFAIAEYLKDTTGREKVEFSFEKECNVSAAIELLEESSIV